MVAWFTQLNEFSLNVLLLLAVVFIKIIMTRFLPFVTQNEPLQFFNWYCLQLESKVNKSKNSISQRNISGFIAALITLLPITIILWIFEDFIAVTWLWHGILLYLAIGNFKLSLASNNISKALSIKQNNLAQQTLKPWVLRDVDRLSTMGIAKTTIEMQLLHYLQGYLLIAFYFLSVGALSALMIRLALMMHYCWNPKQDKFYHFGHFINLVINVIQWLPNRIFTLLMLLTSVGNNALNNTKKLSRQWLNLNNDIVIHSLALNLNIQLAGVAMYNGKKLRRKRFNDHGKQPEAMDILRTTKVIQHIFYFLLALTILLAITTLLIH